MLQIQSSDVLSLTDITLQKIGHDFALQFAGRELVLKGYPWGLGLRTESFCSRAGGSPPGPARCLAWLSQCNRGGRDLPQGRIWGVKRVWTPGSWHHLDPEPPLQKWWCEPVPLGSTRRSSATWTLASGIRAKRPNSPWTKSQDWQTGQSRKSWDPHC